MKRNYTLDKYRGFTIISMVLFHLLFDISLYVNISWYDGTLLNKVWQLSIACSFFIISGITSVFLSPEKNIKRGLVLTLFGLLISLFTYIFDRDLIIIFGVLNCLGLSMIVAGLIEKKFKISKYIFPLFLILFILTYTVPSGRFLSFEISRKIFDLNLFVLGFPSDNFYSTDFFPIIPWIFLFLFGLSLGKLLKEKNFYNHYGKNGILAKIGQNSLKIYLFHQIIIYILVDLYFKYIA